MNFLMFVFGLAFGAFASFLVTGERWNKKLEHERKQFEETVKNLTLKEHERYKGLF